MALKVIPKSRILMWYYPDSNASEVERDEALKQWSKATGVDKNQIKTKCLWNGGRPASKQ